MRTEQDSTAMANTTPLVSVIVTFYNQGPYVLPALESVMGQTYPNFEVIVVDDGSTDDTLARCASVGDRITYVRQANKGAAAARNAGMRRARGSLLAFLDGDDLWEPEKLAVQVAAASRYPESGLIAVDGTQFAETEVLADTLLARRVHALLDNSTSRVVSASCYDFFFPSSCIFTPSQVMIRRAVFHDVGSWDSQVRLSHDYDLYLRIAARYPVTFIGQKLVRWRYLPGSMSGPLSTRQFRYALEHVSIWRKHVREAPFEHRSLIHALLPAFTHKIAREAYYYGHVHDRLWATRYLTRVAMRSRRPHLVVPYLVGLWCPRWIRKVVGLTLRRAFAARTQSPVTGA